MFAKLDTDDHFYEAHKRDGAHESKFSAENLRWNKNDHQKKFITATKHF